MTTMIHVQGAGAGRCDARCYNAKAGTPCACVCNGKNHGVGRDQAVKNTRELFLGEQGAGLDEAGARVQYQMDLEGA